ncbi:aquaporin-like protein [Cavenderia fasciculata]|uniref:Aquaporin-like protein n=1 Tax=Cavenderia fasciculata TaxID=261658 RepID=F4PZP9_CACFS|nr:aquaporin-like protein [Cavenderia fasciculata]EGG18813.1 aquaporin-like protein [Cavenderia fasciculata]|eukprot:XP_004357275.1 aquaporin-like protein [Cavenderia fasciculata]
MYPYVVVSRSIQVLMEKRQDETFKYLFSNINNNNTIQQTHNVECVFETQYNSTGSGGYESKLIIRVHESKKRQLLRQCLAEFVGLMFFTFMVGGSVITANFYFSDPVIKIVLIALIQAMTLAAIIWFTSGVSGCQLNPAVTVSLVFTGRMGILNGILFIIMQCCGALAGSALIKAAVPGHYEGNLGATTLAPTIPFARGFFLEMMGTCLLCLVVLGMSVYNEWDPKLGRYAPLGIGCAVYAGVAMLNPYTGGSLNPARSFGPAVLSDTWHYHYLYWFGPIAGGIVAALLWRFILSEKVALVDRPYADYANTPANAGGHAGK